MWVERLENGKYKYFERYTNPYTNKLHRVTCVLATNSPRAKKQAQVLLSKKIAQKTATKQTKDVTWAHAYELWWADYSRTKKANTLSAKRRNKKRIDTILEDEMLIANIDSLYLQNKLNAMYDDDNLSFEYIHSIFSQIRMVFRFAKLHQMIVQNPTDSIKIEMRQKTIDDLEQGIETKYLENEELAEVINAIKTPRHKLFAEILVLTGMRVGEAISLKYEDYDGKSFKVRSNYNYNAPMEKRRDTPKNEQSFRIIDLPQRAIEITNEFIESNQCMPAIKTTYVERGFIFTSTLGMPIHPADFNASLHKAEQLLSFHNKKLSSHIFRHTHISMLAEMGVNLKAIMARVGHKSPKTTLEIYTHVSEKMSEDLIKLLNSAPFLPLLNENEKINWK
jgi:integrase